jgi:hypothetical protein
MDMKPSPISTSPIAFWLGIGVNVITFICALGGGLAATKVAAVEFTSVIFVLTPISLLVSVLFALARDRKSPFPWLIPALWFAPLPVWFSTWQVCGMLRRLVL